MNVKRNLLLVGVFPSCGEGCHMLSILPTDFHLLKSGVQHLMDNKEILFENTVIPVVPQNFPSHIPQDMSRIISK